MFDVVVVWADNDIFNSHFKDLFGYDKKPGINYKKNNVNLKFQPDSLFGVKYIEEITGIIDENSSYKKVR